MEKEGSQISSAEVNRKKYKHLSGKIKQRYNVPTLKKDELWKPILRTFRKFVRNCLRMDFEINNPLNSNGQIKRNTLLAC